MGLEPTTFGSGKRRVNRVGYTALWITFIKWSFKLFFFFTEQYIHISFLWDESIDLYNITTPPVWKCHIIFILSCADTMEYWTFIWYLHRRYHGVKGLKGFYMSLLKPQGCLNIDCHLCSLLHSYFSFLRWINWPL